MALKSSERAQDFMEKGERKMKSIFGASKYDDACEFFTKAGNLYRIDKRWEDAGGAYCRSAECQIKNKSKHEAASHYVSAAGAYKKVDTTLAAKCLKMSVDLFVDEGRFNIAAKHTQELGELYEKSNDVSSAIESYQRAADFFDGDNSPSRANTCLLKVAQFSATMEKYDEAIQLYEQIAETSLDNNLLKWSCKEYFLKSGLCYMAKGDIIAAKRAINRYQDQDITFSNQRECKFLVEISDAVDEADVDKFTEAVVEYDSVTKLEPWKTTLLLRIKNKIAEEEI